MMLLDESIHVLYGSNVADTWMIAASLLTFASSLILGIAAFKNGQAATQIAQDSMEISREASKREERRLKRERFGAVSVAMLQAFNAIDARLSLWPGSPEHREALLLERRLILEARALTAVYPHDGKGNRLTPWFRYHCEQLTSGTEATGVGTPRYNAALRTLEDAIAIWNTRQLDVNHLWEYTAAVRNTHENANASSNA